MSDRGQHIAAAFTSARALGECLRAEVNRGPASESPAIRAARASLGEIALHLADLAQAEAETRTLQALLSEPGAPSQARARRTQRVETRSLSTGSVRALPLGMPSVTGVLK